MKRKPARLPKLETRAPGKTMLGGSRSRLYYDLRLYLEQDWEATARAFEANPGSFVSAWRYLDGHPIYWRLLASDDKLPAWHMAHLEHGYGFSNGGIWVSVTRVNPATGSISEDPALNTRTEVWLETGEWSWAVDEKRHISCETHYHNYKLDCGGTTYEEAVVEMARNVHRFYGNDRRRCEPEWGDRRRARFAKKHKGRVELTVNNPYAHACRHRYPGGAEGKLQQAQEEVGHGTGDS